MSRGNLDQQALELLAGKALGDLSEEERQRLSEIDIDMAETELEELEATVAAIQLAMLEQSGELPFDLQSKISSSADQYVQVNGIDDAKGSAENKVQLGRATIASELRHESRPAFQAREAFAWITAAAALIISVGLFLAGRTSSPPAGTVASARSELLDSAADLVQVVWANGTTPFDNQVSGDVVWSNRLQEGYLKFVGMPVNDPLIEQYQLWIIDPGRDDEPIDGGVFDISSTGEVIVKINPKLRVVEPQAFAITIEKPGGVVVSTQEKLPLLAQVTL